MPKAGNTTARGYGNAHQAERKRWAKLVASGRVSCCLCDLPIEPDEEFHLDHTPDRRAYRGAAHAYCNTSDGGKRGNSQRGVERRRRWSL